MANEELLATGEVAENTPVEEPANEVAEEVTVENPVAEEAAAESAPAAEVSNPEETLAELNLKLADVEKMKSDVAAMIVRAKAHGLDEEAHSNRTLLRDLIRAENGIRKQIEIKEAEKVRNEVAELEKKVRAAMENTETVEAPAPVAEAPAEKQARPDYRGKEKARRTAAKVIGYLGAFVCLIAAIAYMILCRDDVMSLPFDWMYLIADGAVLVVLVVIALIVNASANGQGRIADLVEKEEAAAAKAAAEEAARKAEEERLAAIEAARLASIADSDVIAAAYELELEETKAKAESENNANLKFINLKAIDPKKMKSQLTGNKKLLVPAVAFCTTVAAATLLAKAKKDKGTFTVSIR